MKRGDEAVAAFSLQDKNGRNNQPSRSSSKIAHYFPARSGTQRPPSFELG